MHGEQNLANAPNFLEELRKQGLIDANAKLLQIENYIYQQVAFNQSALPKLGPQLGPKAAAIFEIINTSHITNLANSIDKWKTAMKPWKEVMNPLLQAN